MDMNILLKRRAIHLAKTWIHHNPALSYDGTREALRCWFLWTYNYIPQPEYLDELTRKALGI